MVQETDMTQIEVHGNVESSGNEGHAERREMPTLVGGRGALRV